MKKVLVVFLALLMVFMMVPVTPDAAYAADMPTLEKTAPAVFDFTQLSNAVKVPGATAAVPTGAKAAPENVTATTFHDETLPNTGWIAIDNDGDGYNWMYAADYSNVFYSLDGQDGECMTSASFINNLGPLNPDNWLISPAITVPANSQLNYFVSGQDPSYAAEHYEVLVSTTSQTDLSTFTQLDAVTVQDGGGLFEGHFVDLRDYAGKTVYIAFRHCKCTDMYWLNLDGLGIDEYTGDDPVAPVPKPTIYRLAGKNRYETSIAIAEEVAGIGILPYMDDPGYFDITIIATGDDFADALAGSALSTIGWAPILLVGSKKPASIDNALAFIDKYSSKNGIIFILGGEKAVPLSVEASLAELGYAENQIVRFAGTNRYETNLQVLSFLDGALSSSGGVSGRGLLVCDGTNWPDAATASSSGIPMMLVKKSGLRDDQIAFLESLSSPNISVIGGPAAVSDDIKAALEDYGASVERIAGNNRQETAVAVAREFFSISSVDMVTFAYALNFPDTISGGLLSYLMDSPILYADSSSPNKYIAADQPYVEDTAVKKAYVLGGDTLVSDDFIIGLLQPNMEL